MQRSSLESDMVFRDGHGTQLATVTGGFTATLTHRHMRKPPARNRGPSPKRNA